MTINYLPMRPGQEDAVASLIRQLPRDLGLDVEPAVTGDMIRHWGTDIHVTVAEEDGVLSGACLWFMHYSTWRGLKGCYISDLYVMEHLRGRKIGQGLLRAAARAARDCGARYLRLDVTRQHAAPKRFYARLGFEAHDDDLTMFLEPDQFKNYVGDFFNMTIKTVGLIGVGLMGHGIGKNILAKGFKLNVVAHRNRAPVESLVALGALEAASVSDLAQSSDMVILVVTGSPQVEDVMAAIIATGKKGLIVADCSTAEPESTLKLHMKAKEAGIHFLDTPMTRTPKEAEAGKLGLMVGGDKALIETIRPVLSCFADLIVHTGAVGSAHQVKLINNFLSLSHAAIAAEAITVAAKAGVNMEALREVIMGGGGASVMFGRLINVPLHDDDTHAKFSIRNARKDLRYYTNMTEIMPVASPLAEQVHQTYVLAETMGYGDRFVPRLITLMMQMAGFKN